MLLVREPLFENHCPKNPSDLFAWKSFYPTASLLMIQGSSMLENHCYQSPEYDQVPIFTLLCYVEKSFPFSGPDFLFIKMSWIQ